MTLALELAALVVLVLFNGAFAMAEMALVSSKRVRLQARAERGSRGARKALALLDDPGEFLSAIQLGITMVGVLSGAVGGAAFAGRVAPLLVGFGLPQGTADAVAFALVVGAITYLSIVVGELVPKRVALADPEAVAATLAGPLGFLAMLGRPVIYLLEESSALILRLIGVRQSGEHAPTEEEMRTIIAESAEAGVIEREERRIIEEVLRLPDRPVRSIMTPRRDVYWIDPGDDPRALEEDLRACPYARVVVARAGSIDAPLGVVSKKDVADLFLQNKPLDLSTVLKQPLYVPENTSVLKMVEEFRRSKIHVAIVVDEYGTMEGLLTTTDILSALVGDFLEEHETGEDAEPILERADGSLLVEGRCDIVTFAARTNIAVPESRDFHTVAGFVLDRLRRLPQTGESFAAEGWTIEVIDMDGPRIDKILVRQVGEPG